MPPSPQKGIDSGEKTISPLLLAAFAVFTLNINTAQADTFGTGGNQFTIDFVNIGNAGNTNDNTGYGAVSYDYRIGKYEISQDAITKATAGGMANVTAGPWTGNQPAADISWFEAAAFVNWLNTNTGHVAAYDLTYSSGWSMNVWSNGAEWTLGGTNLYRNKDAYYFLASDSEWVKAAYYNPGGSNYFLYPTGSDTAPTAVASGTSTNTAVYSNEASDPANANDAGGLSPYGTMGQGGNVWEWTESADAGTNSSSSENRAFRGGDWSVTESDLRSSSRFGGAPFGEDGSIGFRVASVPEPSTYALVLMAGGAWLVRRRLRRSP